MSNRTTYSIPTITENSTDWYDSFYQTVDNILAALESFRKDNLELDLQKLGTLTDNNFVIEAADTDTYNISCVLPSYIDFNNDITLNLIYGFESAEPSSGILSDDIDITIDYSINNEDESQALISIDATELDDLTIYNEAKTLTLENPEPSSTSQPNILNISITLSDNDVDDFVIYGINLEFEKEL